MGTSKLELLLRTVGMGIADGELANLRGVPLFEHLGEALTVKDNYVTPHEADMAEVQLQYESNEALAESEVLELLELRETNPDMFELQLARDLGLRDILDEILRQDAHIREADSRISSLNGKLQLLQGASTDTLRQLEQEQRRMEQRRNRVGAMEEAVGAENTKDTHARLDAQEAVHAMQDLLRGQSPDGWLLSSHPLDELRATVKMILAELAKAKEDRSPADLARCLCAQAEASGALPDTPFAPSMTRMLTGLAPEQYAYVLQEAAEAGTSRRLMRDRSDRLHAELAGLAQQEKMLRQIARGADVSTGNGNGGAGTSAAAQQQQDRAAASALAAEATQLREQVHSFWSSEPRQSQLDSLAACAAAPLKRSLWLLRAEQLRYMRALQEQLGQVALETWARSEVVQILLAEEKQAIRGMYESVRALCRELQQEARAGGEEARELRALAEEAGRRAAQQDCTPQAALGGEPSLRAALHVVETARGRLHDLHQLLQQQEDTTQNQGKRMSWTEPAADAASAAAAAAVDPGTASAAASASALSASSASVPSSVPSSAPASSSSSFSSGRVGGVGGNAFLASLLSDPAQRTVSQLVAGVDAVAGLMARMEQQMHSRVCGQAPQLAAEGRERVEELRSMLAGPAPAPRAPRHAPSAGAAGGGGGSGSGGWPVLRDPAVEAELAAIQAEAESMVAQIQAFVGRSNMLVANQSRQSEQARLERGLLAAFWNAPQQLLADVRALRERLAGMLACG